VDAIDITLSSKYDSIVHAQTVPVISIDAPFPFDSGGSFEVSPTSYSGTPFNNYNQDLQRDGSWETFSQQSDGFLPSLQNDGSWDDLAQRSDGDHGMFRSPSFGGSTDTQLMDEFYNSMTTSTTALHTQSLPSHFEDSLYDPSHRSESLSSAESMSEIQTETGPNSSSPVQLTFYKVTRHENTGAMVATATAEGKRPRGRHGPLDEKRRQDAAKMRKFGSCATCRHRKSKVSRLTNKKQFSSVQANFDNPVRWRILLLVMRQILQRKEATETLP